MTEATATASLKQTRNPAPPSDDTAAELARLRAEVERLTPKPVDVSALPLYDIYYEFVADKADEKGKARGEILRDATDPRWDELANYRRPVAGSLVTREIQRKPGTADVTNMRVARSVQTKNPAQARAQMAAWITNGCAFKHETQHEYGKVASK